MATNRENMSSNPSKKLELFMLNCRTRDDFAHERKTLPKLTNSKDGLKYARANNGRLYTNHNC